MSKLRPFSKFFLFLFFLPQLSLLFFALQNAAGSGVEVLNVWQDGYLWEAIFNSLNLALFSSLMAVGWISLYFFFLESGPQQPSPVWKYYILIPEVLIGLSFLYAAHFLGFSEKGRWLLLVCSHSLLQIGVGVFLFPLSRRRMSCLSPSSFDVAVPTSYFVPWFEELGLTAAIDIKKIPNLKHIDPYFLENPTGVGPAQCVPYLYSYTGIGYRQDLVDKIPSSWGDLWDPSFPVPMNRRSLLNNPREVFGAMHLFHGFDLNAANDEAIGQAKDLISKLRGSIHGFNSEMFASQLATGQTYMAHGWAGSFAAEKEVNPSIKFVVPQEGAVFGYDCFVIPAESMSKELAHQFIDFVLRPEISARIVEHTRFASANKTAQNLIPADLKNDPYLYPDKKELEQAVWFQYQGDKNHLFEDAWKEALLY